MKLDRATRVLGIILLSTTVLASQVEAQTLINTGQNFNPDKIQIAVGSLLCFIEGAFGALIMVVAGIGAIIAAAMGGYRAAVSLLVVAIGAFILRSLLTLFFSQGVIDSSRCPAA